MALPDDGNFWYVPINAMHACFLFFGTSEQHVEVHKVSGFAPSCEEMNTARLESID